LWATFKDLIILAVAFYIPYRYRHKIKLYARGMIVTGIACIEPAAARINFLTLYSYFIIVVFV